MVVQFNVLSFYNVGASSLPKCLEGSKNLVDAWSVTTPTQQDILNPAFFQDAGQ